MLAAFGDLARLRGWWDLVSHALRMRPHPAARPGAGEEARGRYLVLVLVLFGAGEWISARLRDRVVEKAVRPLDRLRDLAARSDIPEAAELDWILRLIRARPQAPQGMTPLLEPWMLSKACETGTLVLLTVLVARTLRPRIPLAGAAVLGLSAAAATEVWNLLVAFLAFRIEDAAGIAAALDAAVAPDGRPLPGFDAAIDALVLFSMGIGLLATLAIVAMAVCLGRGLRRAGHGRAAASGLAVLVTAAACLAGVAASKTSLAAWLPRLLSF